MGRSRRFGFTLLEAAVALVTLVALSGASVAGVREARTEFEHAENRAVVQNLTAAATTDAAARQHRFDPGLLPMYASGSVYGVGGVATITTDLAAVSTAPGDVVVWFSGDQITVSVAMASTRGRCLQALTVAGQVSAVRSVRLTPCRPILPDALNLAPGEAAPTAPIALTAVPGNAQVTLSWTPTAGDALYLAIVEPAGATCTTATTSCVIALPAGQYTATVVAANAAGTSPPSAPTVPFAVSTVPAAPTDLAVVAGAGQVQLSWALPTDNGDPLSGHRIRFHTGADWTELTHGLDPAATVGDLSPGVEYAFQVAGVNSWGVGAFSPTVTATIYATPGPPGLSVEGGDQSLVVTLTAPSGAGSWPTTGYAVAYQVQGSGDDWTEVVRETGGTFTISDLQSGVIYLVRARTLSPIGDSEWSASVQRITLPGVPTVSVAYAPPEVTVSWAPLTGAVGYDVARSIGGGASVTVASQAGTSFTETVQPDSTYTYQVRACNGAGCGAWSAPQSVATVPSAPTITQIVTGDRELSVSFTHAALASLTMLEYSTDGGATWRDRATGTTASPLVITTRSSDNVALVNGTAYQVQLRAVSAAGTGTASATVSATPVTTPGAPTITSATAGTLSISVAFTAPTDTGGTAITGYEYSTDNGATWRVRSAGTTGSPLSIAARSSDNVTLVAGTTYTVRIRAVNAQGAGAASSSATATPYNVPGAPNLTATDSHLQANLSWTVPASNGSTITGYQIQYKASSSAQWLQVSANDIVGTSWTVSGLAPRVSYDFRVAARNAAGLGPWSVARSATPWTDTLFLGETMTAGQFLRSANGTYTLTLENDGNLVLRQGATILWKSHNVSPAMTTPVLHMSTTSPGNLNIYDGTVGNIKWSTFGACSSNPKAGAFTILQGTDGNLVTYNNAMQPLWSRTTGTIGWIC